MRQNITDIVPRWHESKLRYGLSIDIDLGDFDFNKIDLSKENLFVDVSAHEGLSVSNKEMPYVVEVPNIFDDFHLKNTKNITTLTILGKIKENIELKTILKSEHSVHQVNIVMEPNSEAVIVDVLEDETDSGFNSKCISIIANENSKLDYYAIQKISYNKIHYSKKSARTKDNATVNWYDFSLGSKITLSEASTILEGPKSNSLIQSVFFSDQNQKFDISGQAIHRVNNTFSNVEAKGAIKDKSQALYRGNVHIEQHAQDSEGYQKADIRMMDDEAEADAIPQLLIDNNEVKCSHAVAIGKIDPEMVFYLMSRGISEKDARHQIIRGFLESTLDEIKIDSVKQDIFAEIDKKMLR